MKKYEVVKEKRRFDTIINTGKYIKNDIYVIYFLNNDVDFSKFGLAVGKKIGNAVVRNNYKRKLRNIIDNNKLLFKNNRDYIIILKRKCLDVSFDEMNNSLNTLLKERL